MKDKSKEFVMTLSICLVNKFITNQTSYHRIKNEKTNKREVNPKLETSSPSLKRNDFRKGYSI